MCCRRRSDAVTGTHEQYRLTRLADALPSTVPFVGHETGRHGPRFDAGWGRTRTSLAARAVVRWQTEQWIMADCEGPMIYARPLERIMASRRSISLARRHDGLLSYLVAAFMVEKAPDRFVS